MTTKRNSASPQAIAKNLLDLFGPPEPGLKSKRRGLLYYDDSQVQGLTVSRWIGGSPRIDVTAMPMQSFAEDLKLAERARRETTDEVVRDLDYLEDSPSLHLAGEVGYIEELRRLTEHEAAFRNTFGRAYPSHLHFVRRKAQACLLRRSRPSIQLLSGVLSGWAQESEKEVLSWYLSRQLEDLLRHTCQIQLGELPTGAGTKKAYKKAVTEAVRDFQERYAWILNPLLFPVAVEIFVKPPPPHKGNHLHDLDNILLEYIVPSVLTIFQPSEPLHLDSVMPTNRLASGRGTVFGYTRPTARSGMAGITRLEAWRLHRDVNDMTEGYVNLLSKTIAACTGS